MPTTAATISIRTTMPTEREQSQYNDLGHDVSKYKSDGEPPYRLPFLDRVQPCWPCVTIRTVTVYSLALYGLYSIFF